MSDGHEGQFATQLAAVRKIATEVAAQHATDVDAKSRFPRESLVALKGAKLLAAPVPIDLGGLGFGMRELAALCSTLAQACGSSARTSSGVIVQTAVATRGTAIDRSHRPHVTSRTWRRMTG